MYNEKQILLLSPIEDRIMEIIEKSDSVPYSDLQAAVSTAVMSAFRAGQNDVVDKIEYDAIYCLVNYVSGEQPDRDAILDAAIHETWAWLEEQAFRNPVLYPEIAAR